ncbi:MAG: nucleoside triphosphate pyrophosphohydrolase [Bacteroidetes bacterium]|nr:nucleoside triphosphate pyrophosphohydrolase [Bacteroidota bacterium]MBT3749527.1 nucleoside triphosphate pyrophosphohydrolase [Bacteroidota bacterium]MBT4398539.1 nucleoside triphosphate pyrophosphohydrolase [Bacteroidota bacterium]MBT4411925.1 nucleoside triphosphate pyrophosphohydrolase [Bacteroidota bacterium]
MTELLREKTLAEFGRLLEIMDELRTKCPWDKEQTWESLRTLTIEETYELADAIVSQNADGIREELGDLMLHIVFYAKIGDEQKAFTLLEVLDKINHKLKFRHPHIFGDVKVTDAREVEHNWEKLKLKEGKKKTVLGGIPDSLPALIKAYRIQDKARGIGFDWDHKEQVWDKVKEELAELEDEMMQQENQAAIEAEFGDVFFSLINAARLYGINPENALEKTNLKFISRFNYLEEKTLQQGMNLREMTVEEMDVYWNEAKDLNT